MAIKHAHIAFAKPEHTYLTIYVHFNKRWWLNERYAFCLRCDQVVTELVPLKCELISHENIPPLSFIIIVGWECAPARASPICTIIFALPLAVSLSAVLIFINTQPTMFFMRHSFNCTTFPIRVTCIPRTKPLQIFCVQFFEVLNWSQSNGIINHLAPTNPFTNLTWLRHLTNPSQVAVCLFCRCFGKFWFKYEMARKCQFIVVCCDTPYTKNSHVKWQVDVIWTINSHGADIFTTFYSLHITGTGTHVSIQLVPDLSFTWLQTHPWNWKHVKMITRWHHWMQ